jgi:hypothetical protein
MIHTGGDTLPAASSPKATYRAAAGQFVRLRHGEIVTGATGARSRR